MELFLDLNNYNNTLQVLISKQQLLVSKPYYTRPAPNPYNYVHELKQLTRTPCIPVLLIIFSAHLMP